MVIDTFKISSDLNETYRNVRTGYGDVPHYQTLA